MFRRRASRARMGHGRRQRRHIGYGVGQVYEKFKDFLARKRSVVGSAIPKIAKTIMTEAKIPLAEAIQVAKSIQRTRYDPMTSSHVGFGRRRHRLHRGRGLTLSGMGYRNY